MRYSPPGAEYDVIELAYDDPVNNSHKFYTIYMDLLNDKWWAHYGRIGTAGAKTAKKNRASAGIKQGLAKYQKGYEILRQGRLTATTPGDTPRGQLIERAII